MSIFFTTLSVFVDDQERARDVYTRHLGFVVRQDVPVGEHRWLTVTDAAGSVELLLEPNDHPAAQAFQSALVADGIPAASFGTDDLRGEHERLVAAGLTFVQPPTDLGPVSVAVFDDTCGNLIQLAQMA
jgi:catechol 2,3-dioxygenase-like lactoylglutathione lyase family enzyme